MTGISLRELAFARSPLPTLILDAAARVVDVNEAYLEMTRRTRDDVQGLSTIDFIHADDLSASLAGYVELEAGARSVRQRRRHRRGDGTWLEVESVTSRLVVDGEVYLLVQLLAHDEAADLEIDADVESRLLLQPYGDSACFHDAEGRITFATGNLANLLGRPIGWLLGRRLSDPELHPVHADGRPLRGDEDPVLEALRAGTDLVRTVGLRATGGDTVWLSVRAGTMASPRVPARSTMRDITELIHAQEDARQLAALVERELAHRADHDSLTGLKTRHVIVQAIGARLDRRAPVSVVFVDLDGFKAVNDEQGHLAGDEVLVAVARHLEALAPPEATLGRNGGDEFVAVFDDPGAAIRFAEDVGVATLTRPPMRPLRASVGVAHSEPGDTVRRVLQRADDAMYAAKRTAGRP